MKKTTINIIPFVILFVILTYASIVQYGHELELERSAQWMASQEAKQLFDDAMRDVVTEHIENGHPHNRFEWGDAKDVLKRIEILESHVSELLNVRSED